MNMEIFNNFLSGLTILAVSAAVFMRKTYHKERKALKKLRDRDIIYQFYIHHLRSKYTAETGKLPPSLPAKLLDEDDDDEFFAV